ncbi:MAG: DNA methyltransferase [Nitrososphaerota archaeon]|nr:site-specific DNA-methyltransferase [Candidatus Calditenuaceae archaeon]MDW8073088.1 DNA methyltransferase [Nitrososphaerota archaeon]
MFQGAYPLEERYDLWSLATFKPNRKIPVHRWFYFKEGFSRELVVMLAGELGVSEGDIVLDPFVGSGTTPLTCMELGYRGIGVDASPLAVFVSLAKTRIYSPDELRQALDSCLATRPIHQVLDGLSNTVKRAFPMKSLQELLSLMDAVETVENEDSRIFLKLALMNAAVKASYIYRDGSVLKFVKRPVPPLRPLFRKIAQAMIDDVKKIHFRSGPAIILEGDARRLEAIEDESVNVIITSPPYLNKIEYTKMYEVELELFFRKKRLDLLRSYIGLIARSPPREIPSLDGLPDSAKLYFYDMSESLKEMWRVLMDGGRAAVVVAGGVYPDKVVESDVILAALAEDVGFKVEKIRVISRRVATSGRTHRIGAARESIIYLRK